MEHTNVESAVEQTLKAVASEFGGTEHLSADWIGDTEQGEPIISVINLQTRDHWQLIVKALPLAKR